MIKNVIHTVDTSWIPPFFEEKSESIVPLFLSQKIVNRITILPYRKNYHDNH